MLPMPMMGSMGTPGDGRVGGLGPELLTNGDFSDGLTGYVNGSTGTGTLTVPGGVATLVGVDAANRGAFNRSLPFAVGRTYRLTWVGTGIGTVGFGLVAGFNASVAAVVPTTNVVQFVATATTLFLLAFTPGAGGAMTVDDFSLREVYA